MNREYRKYDAVSKDFPLVGIFILIALAIGTLIYYIIKTLKNINEV